MCVYEDNETKWTRFTGESLCKYLGISEDNLVVVNDINYSSFSLPGFRLEKSLYTFALFLKIYICIRPVWYCMILIQGLFIIFCIHIYTYLHIRTQIHTHIYIHTNNTSIHTFLHTCTYICIHPSIYMYYVYIYMSINIHLCTHTHDAP